jgi:peptidase M1-like protein
MAVAQALRSPLGRNLVAGLLLAGGLPQVSFAQTGSGTLSPGVSYEQRYNEIRELQAVPRLEAQVNGLVLNRDVGQFTLESGKLYLLTPVGGRTMGAVFLGTGRFSFMPPTRIEQDRLARFQKTRSLETAFSSLVLLFADSTAAELESKLSFQPAQGSPEVWPRFRSSLETLGDDDSKSLDPDLMSAFLNSESNGLFYASVGRTSGGPLMFMVNPHEVEGVSLWQRVRRYGWTRRSEVICQFAPGGPGPAGSITGERIHDATIRHYTIATALTESGGGDLNFVAAAKLEITGDVAMGPWVAFGLFEKLKVDSARWEGGERATVFKGKDGSLLWIKLDDLLQAGEMRSLNLYYHGDLIDRYGDFFFIKSSAEWYPRPLDGRSLATFDLTFSSPKDKLLASVGEQLESSAGPKMKTSHWVTSRPIRNASFNLGLFQDYRIREEGIPPVTVLVSEDAHRKLGGLRQKHMKETVGSDVARSLRFFQHAYGQLPAKQVFATEIPGNHGEAFPGMINLSWATFQETDQQGEDEMFRAHEVAHQWWGIGVDFTSYHDQWLSEGFASFSGLWYLQTVRKDNRKYFAVLDRWRAHIFEHNDEPSPIWLGYRAASSKDETGYSVLVYKKGAWVLHMLRTLMLDLKTMNEDRFTETMRDFYKTYEGKRASTENFRRVAEQHAGADLGWFFDQWVYRTDIPRYRVAYKTRSADGGQYRVTLQVYQESVPDDFKMYVPVTLDLGNGQEGRFRVKVQGPKSEIDLPLLPAKPKGLRFNDLEGVLAEVKMVDWRD